MDKKRKHILNKYDKNLKSFEYKSSFYTASALARPRARHTSPIYLLHVYFKLEFYRLQQAENPVQTRKKNPVYQT